MSFIVFCLFSNFTIDSSIWFFLSLKVKYVSGFKSSFISLFIFSNSSKNPSFIFLNSFCAFSISTISLAILLFICWKFINSVSILFMIVFNFLNISSLYLDLYSFKSLKSISDISIAFSKSSNRFLDF